MDHHSDKLGTIRTIRARTRMQLIWQIYTYLRDGQRTKYVSSELQLKWSEAVREKLEEMEAKMERWTTERGNPPPPRDNTRDENTCRCSHCKSSEVHPGGRALCPWKETEQKLARKMARTAIAKINAGQSKETAIQEATAEHQD